ncbi:MAG: prolipoprotein diacylglyceryl transferase [Xanthomonadaceae bacterium]|nr:prolipoprotein diacylglyceryl transferase [Rhodospirillaceae bacterium]NIA18095.1 prolipoprotein diacylglyceryl transferase [Xanthomonadaceae bacterium]
MLTIFLHTYHPSPIIFSLGYFQFYWYGFFISLSIVIGIIIGEKLAKKYKIEQQRIFDLAIYIIIFGLLGARIYHILMELNYYIQHPLDVFKFWQGGLAIHGAIIGGIIAGYFYSKKYKMSFWLNADIIAVSLALGQAIGRWGNYFNQELFGFPTNLPWGIPIDSFNRLFSPYKNFEYFHPAFLYESILNFLNFLFLLFLHKKKIANNHLVGRQAKTKILSDGNIFLIYILNYSLIRFVMEFIRSDETALIFGFRFPQILSALLFIFIVILLKIRIRK